MLGDEISIPNLFNEVNERDFLIKIHELFNTNNKGKCLVVFSKEAQGKTLLALQYVVQHNSTWFVKWISCECESAIKFYFRNKLARDLGVQVCNDHVKLLARIKEKINSLTGNYLFIFDNVVKYEWIVEYISIFDLRKNFRILLTTNHKGIYENISKDKKFEIINLGTTRLFYSKTYNTFECDTLKWLLAFHQEFIHYSILKNIVSADIERSVKELEENGIFLTLIKINGEDIIKINMQTEILKHLSYDIQIEKEVLNNLIRFLQNIENDEKQIVITIPVCVKILEFYDINLSKYEHDSSFLILLSNLYFLTYLSSQRFYFFTTSQQSHYLLKSYEILKNLNVSDEQLSVRANSLGLFYYNNWKNVDELNLAERYFREAIYCLFSEENVVSTKIEPRILNNLALVYYSVNNTLKAKILYANALSNLDEDDHEIHILILLNLCGLFIETDEISSGRIVLCKAFKIFHSLTKEQKKAFKYKDIFVYRLVLKAIMFQKTGKLNACRKYMHKAFMKIKKYSPHSSKLKANVQVFLSIFGNRFDEEYLHNAKLDVFNTIECDLDKELLNVYQAEVKQEISNNPRNNLATIKRLNIISESIDRIIRPVKSTSLELKNVKRRNDYENDEFEVKEEIFDLRSFNEVNKVELFLLNGIIAGKIKKDFNMQISYFIKAYDLCDRQEFKFVKLVLLLNISAFFGKHADYQLEFLQRADELALQIKYANYEKSAISFDMGKIYLQKGEYLKASNHFEKSLDIYKNNFHGQIDPHELAKIYKFIFESYKMLNNIPQISDKRDNFLKEYLIGLKKQLITDHHQLQNYNTTCKDVITEENEKNSISRKIAEIIKLLDEGPLKNVKKRNKNYKNIKKKDDILTKLTDEYFENLIETLKINKQILELQETSNFQSIIEEIQLTIELIQNRQTKNSSNKLIQFDEITKNDIENFKENFDFYIGKETMKLDDHSYYKIQKGLKCLVINNLWFEEGNSRIGSQNDSKRLKRLFETILNYKYISFENCSKSQFENCMNDFLKDYKENDYLYDGMLIFIMSHGKENQIQTSDQQFINLYEILNDVNNAAISGKPSLIFIQACRSNDESSEKNENKSANIYNMNDMFLWQSVVKYQTAKRDTVEGSNFVRCLVTSIIKCGWNNDLYNLFLKVNSLLELFESENEKKSQKFTQSSLYSSATKQFFFKSIESFNF